MAVPVTLAPRAVAPVAALSAAGDGLVPDVRTKLNREGGVRRPDAVYTVSPSLPGGHRTMDAAVAFDAGHIRGIPTV
ncbi:hypothetical protein [uncultured Jannaschia sp.]|uniref:hypothetical protein n=1 Tax=uncultured Jannaschia sp. TaxID=293347 RepID=UPI002634D015|nr:hypothetical protein [uncultured Jannaschia sp.]